MTSDDVPPPPDGLQPTAGAPASAAAGAPQRPAATWKAWEAVAVYLVAILIGGLVTIPFFPLIEDDDLATLASTTAAAVAITGVLVGWLSTSHPTWRRIMGFPQPGRWWAEIRPSIGFGLLLYPGMVFGVGLLLGLLLSGVSGERASAPEQVPSDLSAVGAIVTSLYALVIAPIHEELFFRGVLFRAVRDRWGLGRGLIASGIAFSMIHYLDAPWQDTLLLMGVMLFNGVALGWWYERRGTVVAPMVAHIVFNVIGLTLIFTIGG